jgi:ribose transport system substrate-binding protein
MGMHMIKSAGSVVLGLRSSLRSIAKILVAVGPTTVVALGAAPVAAQETTFGYVPASMAYPFNVATAKGFREEAAKVGVKTVVLDSKGKVEAQGNAIDDLLTQKVAGIGFLPLDSVVAQSWVDKIAALKVPIVAVASQVGDPEKRPLKNVYEKLTALVTTDDVLAGEVGARLAMKFLPTDRVAKIAIIEGAPGYANVRQRTEGFKSELQKAGVKFEIVSSQPTDWTPEKGEAVCQTVLISNPDVDLFFSQADDMAIGCARAIQAAGSKAKLMATAGGSKLGIDAIKAGELDGSVCAKPELLGRLMFKALYEATKNPAAPKAQFLTYDMPEITKDNLAECPPEW